MGSAMANIPCASGSWVPQSARVSLLGELEVELPSRSEKGTRSHSFPIYLNFAEKEKTRIAHHERMRRNLLAFVGQMDCPLRANREGHIGFVDQPVVVE